MMTTQQNYNAFSNCKNVFCSDLISYGKSNPFFQKIVRDYEKGTPTKVKVSFKNRDFHFAIYRYMKFKHLKKMIEGPINGDFNFKLSFISPYLWDDPCESVFYKPAIQIQNEWYNILCICTTLEPTENEESAWRRAQRSNDTDEKTVRVAFDFSAFCQTLEKIASKEGDLSFYLSLADYSESRDFFKKNKPYSTLDEYIELMSKKRKAFAYENEMRIFAVRKIKSSDCETQEETKDFDIDLSEDERNILFKDITLPPYPPIPKKNPQSHFYHKIQDYDNLDLRIGIEDLSFPNTKIKQSRLYELKSDNSFAKSLVDRCKGKNNNNP